MVNSVPSSSSCPSCLKTRSALLGLFTHEARWGLSARGLVCFAITAPLVAIALLLSIHPVLAISVPIPASTLVVEGWIEKAALQASAQEFKRGNYDQVIVTFPWITASPANAFDPRSSSVTRHLTKNGVPEDAIHIVFPARSDRNRTYESARAVAHFLKGEGRGTAVNVFTEGLHARRSRLLFEKALGSEIPVGVIAAPPDGYNPERWWKYSEGIKEVISETIAYTYSRFLFWPSEEI